MLAFASAANKVVWESMINKKHFLASKLENQHHYNLVKWTPQLILTAANQIRYNFSVDYTSFKSIWPAQTKTTFICK